MTKCKNCGKEAKWKSTKYDSPLCTECARKVVDELIAKGECNIDETAVIDHFIPIHINIEK